MKNLYLSMLLAALFLGAFPRLHAQTYTAGDISVTIVNSMMHDSTACQSFASPIYMFTISNSYVGDSVKIIDTTTHGLIYAAGNTLGANPWVFSIPVMLYTPSISDDQVSGGAVLFFGPTTKIICDTDTVHAIPHFYPFPVPNPCLYSYVSGKAYVDNNSDCIYNTGDVLLNGLRVHSTATLFSPGTPTNYRYTYTTGGPYNLTIQKSWMTSYDVSIAPEYYFIFPPTSCFSGVYTYTTLPHTNVDFPLQCTGMNDMFCWAGSEINARYNTPFHMQPYVSNRGCDTISGVLNFVKDSRVSYNPGLSINPATSVSGDTLKWVYTHLTNLTGGGYWNNLIGNIHLTPDTSAHVGDTLHFRVFTAVPSTDPDATNNDYYIDLPVVAAYDPNSKDVTPKGTGAPGYIPATTPDLTYTIHFQNTGTASAIQVSVIDTLDADVTPSSLRVLGVSHTMTPEWLAPGVVRFNFYAIYLPDSNTNEPASHGFVRFSVKPHTGLAPGTEIKNKGYIYFDSNPPIITNTALNTIQAPSFTGTYTTVGDIVVYPNPATDQIFIDNLNEGNVAIMGIDGAVVATHHVTSTSEAIDISKLPAGLYILKIISKDNTAAVKFIKQ